MYALDFEYDSQYLSSFGFIICDFNFSEGANEVTAGSIITFNKVPRIQGKKNSLSSTQYDECITTSFDICKNPDIYDLERMEISDDEYRDIARWLNRKEFLKFCVLDNDKSEQEICYFNASFNINKIKIREKLYGIRLTMETDKPFGYGREQVYQWTFTNTSRTKVFNDISDEIGIIYPTVIIKCNQAGRFAMYNSDIDGVSTIIANCSVGEEITLHGDTQIITTSRRDHDICKDFNYEFFKIGNTYESRKNTINVALPSIITLKYFPIIKDAP